MAVRRASFSIRHFIVWVFLAMLVTSIGCNPSDLPPPNSSQPKTKQLDEVAVPGLPVVSSESSKPSGSVVKLVREEDKWQLIRDGEPYYVRGAGGEGSLEALAAAGANSNRTWGVGEGTLAKLDEASKNGLSVAVGIWLEHERLGMDYSDYNSVVKQIDLTMKHVRKVKHHPALLVWGIGNEMEGPAGDNPAIYSHIEHLAQLVKQEDPHHPVMTVIAEMGGKKIEAIHKLCPSVDIIGINSYGGARTLPERYRRLGGRKPYIVTEFGPIGSWEVPKNSIDAINEPTSTAKAAMYRAAAEAFAKDTEFCLGSYAFLWGNKQEATATWFGMLLPDGKRTAAADTMAQIWAGNPPSNLCPVINRIVLDGPALVEKGKTVSVRLDASDPENDTLNIRWVVTGEADSYTTGGDLQASPEELESSVVYSDLNGARVKLPEVGGVYRIYAYVDDGNNGAATANVSVRVKADPAPITEPGQEAELPLVVLDEPGQQVAADGAPFYIPSGFMGSIDAISLDETCVENPKEGKHCTRVEYNKGEDWGGVVWQNPENDWGDEPGGFDLTGAKKLTFWVRGESGDETVKFGFGVLGRDKTYFDSAKKEVEVKLTDEWKQYSFDLEGEDLQRIKTGFFFSIAGQGKPVVFFLDRIVFE